MTVDTPVDQLETISLDDLKQMKPGELNRFAEQVGIKNPGSMRKQDIFYQALKDLAERGVLVRGRGVLEVLQDGFGFLRAPEANYLAGPDDIYVSQKDIRQFGLRTGDTISGLLDAPKGDERYFALNKSEEINFSTPEQARMKAHFDNLTPLYPDQRFKMELEDPTAKDTSGRVIDIVAPIGKGQRALIVAPPSGVSRLAMMTKFGVSLPSAPLTVNVFWCDFSVRRMTSSGSSRKDGSISPSKATGHSTNPVTSSNSPASSTKSSPASAHTALA
jgi:transcription termination factor Rho